MASSPSQLCIHGNFVLIGKEPDGDSVRFVPTNPALLQELNRAYRIKPSTVDGSVQLRFEGIDAPELHYGAALQPLGSVARDALLSKVGFTNIQYKGTTVTDCMPKTIPGAILAVMAEANGRPVSYILVGTQLPPDGEWVAVTDHILKQTMNYAMITNGMAYYTVYTSMPKHHRTVFHEAAQAARQQSAPLAAAAGAGVGVTASTSSATGNATVWNLDSSREFRLDDQNSIGPNGALILPKLFRRCTDYLRDVNQNQFDGNLTDWMRAKDSGSRSENDKVVVNGVELKFADLIAQNNRTISLQADILDMIFVEK